MQPSALAPQCFGLAATIFEGNPGGGTITSNGSGGFTITGTSGNDVIVGSTGNDVIDAGDGTDRVCAGEGDDVISGGGGTNRIDGDLGVDMVDYGVVSAGVRVNLTNGTARNASIIESISNVEHIRGSAFDDDLRGDSLSNLIFGAAGNDILVGFGAADTLLGQDGHDALNGGDGADVLSGGAGFDGFLPGAGADQIVGQGGFDIVNYNGSDPIEVNLATNTGTNGDAAGDTWAGIESIVGTAGADLLTGDGDNNEFDGRGGDDVIHGGAGRDRLIGGAGSDEIHGGDGVDHISGQDGDDTLSGDEGDDVFVPGSGFNIIDGGIGNDRIYSGNCLDAVTSVEIVQTSACAGDATQAVITSDSASLVAGSGHKTIVTVQLQDASGNSMTLGGRAVTIATTAGTLSVGAGEFASVAAVDNNDGTYSATLTAGASLGTAVLTLTVDGNAATGTHDVAFLGDLHHFAVTFTDEGVIPAQGTTTAFNIRIVALDAAENPASYNGTVDLTYEGTVNGVIGVGGGFVAGVLTPHAVTIPEEGSVAIRATRSGGAETGVSTAFTVTAPFIVMTPDTSFVLSGETVALTAVVKNFDGTDAADQTVVWSSSDETFGTVDAAGVVTGVAPGNIGITATQGTLSSSAAVGVCPNLAVGGVYTDTFPSAASICFGGTSSGQEYTYMPVNLSTSVALSLSVTGRGIQAVSGPPSPNVVPANANMLGNLHEFADATLHAEMLAANARLPLIGSGPVNERPSQKLSIAFGSANNAVQMSVIPAGVPSVGDLWNINVGATCNGVLDTRIGRVVGVSTHAVLVSDTTNPAGGFTTAQYDSIGLEFDSIAYPVVSENFGNPTDIDGNGRIVMFFTRAVNELSPPASSLTVDAYHATRDLSAVGTCVESNMGEVLYMLTPDPTGAVNSNVRTVSSVRGKTNRVAGHELQHLTNAGRRLHVTGASSFEEVWLNEQLSAVAEELMFYRTSVGLAPRGNIILSTLTSGPNASRRVAAFNTYANINFGQMRSWLQRPDTLGAFKNTTSFSVSGAGWGFLRYAADRVNGTDSTFWSALVNSQLEGLANIENAIGGADPGEWLRDFTAAMYADDAVAGAAATYAQPSWNFRSVYGGLGGFPLLARPLADNTTLTLSYSRGGGTAYVRFGVPASGYATLTALSGGLAPTSPYRLIVMRTK